MAVSRSMGRDRRGFVGAALPDINPAAPPPAQRVGFVSAYDRLRLHNTIERQADRLWEIYHRLGVLNDRIAL